MTNMAKKIRSTYYFLSSLRKKYDWVNKFYVTFFHILTLFWPFRSTVAASNTNSDLVGTKTSATNSSHQNATVSPGTSGNKGPSEIVESSTCTSVPGAVGTMSGSSLNSPLSLAAPTRSSARAKLLSQGVTIDVSILFDWFYKEIGIDFVNYCVGMYVCLSLFNLYLCHMDMPGHFFIALDFRKWKSHCLFSYPFAAFLPIFSFFWNLLLIFCENILDSGVQ